MSFLAEILAVVVVWLSSLALCQFGVVIDKQAEAKPPKARVVSRSPRATPAPVAARASPAAAATT